MIGRVDIEGVRDIQKALRSVDKDLPKRLKDAGNAAAQIIVDDTRARARTPAERRVARSVKVSSQQRSVAVSVGGRGFPEAGGVIFGAAQDRLRVRRSGRYVGYRQFRPWLGAGRSAGYLLFPSIRARQDDVVKVYLDQVDRLVAGSGL